MLFAHLERCAQDQPHHVALISESCSLTYENLLRRTQDTAVYLQTLGVHRGDPLVVAIPPCPEFYVLFFAAAAVGAVTIPVSTSGKLPPQVRALDAFVAVGEPQLLQAFAMDGARLRHEIHWHPGAGLAVFKTARKFERAALVVRENVLGTSTSGTTGEPVIFFRTAEELVTRAQLRIDGLGISADDTLLSVGPFTSGVNAVFHLVLPIVARCAVVLLEKFDRRKLVKAISQHRVSVLCTVPLTFELLGHLPKSYDADFSSLKTCLSNGAPLSKNIYRKFHDRFAIGIGQTYGGSDFAPAFTFNIGKVAEAVGQKAGPFPVCILDESGNIVPDGDIGEINFDLSGVTHAGMKDILMQNPLRRGPYLPTGDLGRFDDQENLFVVGRKSRLIKVGANRVMPAEVESTLRQHPHIREAVVYPINAGQTDEAVAAAIVVDSGLTDDDIKDYCARHLESYKCPRTIEFYDALPRNAHGKVTRYTFDSNRS